MRMRVGEHRSATTSHRVRRPAVALVASAALLAVGCGSGDGHRGTDTGSRRPEVVVTLAVWADLVRTLAGDAVDVNLIVPNGQDPHDYSPSARDVAAIRGADLVVATGLDLEEGLVDPLGAARRGDIEVFEVTDHVTVRAGDEPDEHGGRDPHVWTDPLTVAEAVPDLAAALGAVARSDLSGAADREVRALQDLDDEVRRTMGSVPAGRCVLVTGHDSLGYFADRYGCRVVGTVVPGFSSTAEASARQIEALRETVEREGAPVVFTEVGTPVQVARRVADEAGVPLVELPSHRIPDEGGYPAFVQDLASRIAGALAS